MENQQYSSGRITSSTLTGFHTQSNPQLKIRDLVFTEIPSISFPEIKQNKLSESSCKQEQLVQSSKIESKCQQEECKQQKSQPIQLVSLVPQKQIQSPFAQTVLSNSLIQSADYYPPSSDQPIQFQPTDFPFNMFDTLDPSNNIKYNDNGLENQFETNSTRNNNSPPFQGLNTGDSQILFNWISESDGNQTLSTGQESQENQISEDFIQGVIFIAETKQEYNVLFKYDATINQFFEHLKNILREFEENEKMEIQNINTGEIYQTNSTVTFNTINSQGGINLKIVRYHIIESGVYLRSLGLSDQEIQMKQRFFNLSYHKIIVNVLSSHRQIQIEGYKTETLSELKQFLFQYLEYDGSQMNIWLLQGAPNALRYIEENQEKQIRVMDLVDKQLYLLPVRK